MEARKKNFLKDFFIYGFGDLSSKLIVFILLPLYSRTLSQADFGFLELILATQTFVTPIVLFQIVTSVYRFLIDKKKDPQEVFTSSILFIFFSVTLFLIIYLSFNYYYNFNLPYINIILCLYVVNVFHIFFKEVARGIGNTIAYSTSGIIKTIVSGSLNILFLVYYGLSYEGVMLAMVFGNITSLIYLFLILKSWDLFRLNKFDFLGLKSLLAFSGPLIPNALLWWLISLSDRYLIDYYLDKSELGIYSMAAKISSMLLIFNTVINQAWQSAAIREDKSKSRDKFYTEVFQIVIVLELFIVFVGAISSKYVVALGLSEDYFSSWPHIPILLAAAMFHFFGTFYGVGYWTSKKMKGALYTSLAAAILNIGINLLFLKHWGIWVASISTLVSYSIMWVLRVLSTKEFFKIEVNYYKLFLSIFLIIIVYLYSFYPLSITQALTSVLSIIIIYFSYKKVISKGKNLIINLIRRK